LKICFSEQVNNSDPDGLEKKLSANPKLNFHRFTIVPIRFGDSNFEIDRLANV